MLALQGSRMARACSRRGGLTLLELVVVIMILVALAGLLIPSFTDIMHRTRYAVQVDNCVELSKAIQLYRNLYLHDPDQYDSLLDDGGNLFSFIPGLSVTPGLTVGTLDGDSFHALENAHIWSVWDMDSSVTNPESVTFSPPYKTPVRTLAAGSKVCQLTNEALATWFGVNVYPGDIYVVFGVGPKCTMVGKVINDPPVHFADEPNQNPALRYCRLGAVYKVFAGPTSPKPGALERAELIATLTFHDDHVEGTAWALQDFYNQTK
jgi:type II secretory pathway pseudopilin PulG